MPGLPQGPGAPDRREAETVSKREYERRTADHGYDWRDQMAAAVPRQSMSELFERRTRRTWAWLREMLEERRDREGGLSAMNQETLARPEYWCSSVAPVEQQRPGGSRYR